LWRDLRSATLSGLPFIQQAFLSGDQLGRNIAQPLVLTAIAILLLLGLLEWGIRILIRRRRARAVPPPA
jgi:hypothetical protein